MEEEKVKLLRQIAGGITVSGGGGSLGALYYPTPPNLASGASTSLYTDSNGNLKTTHATLNAGEDLTNDVQKVEFRYSPFNLTTTATISIVKSTSGYLHNVNIGMLSNPTITIYDNASGASGTVLLHVQPLGLGAQDSYLVNLSFTNGLTAYMTGGNSTIITGGYR